MTRNSTDVCIRTIGIDIAKRSFALHGLDEAGRTVLKKELKRHEVLAYFQELAPVRIGPEACAGAHHWARELGVLGHEVKLVAPSRVKAFVVRQEFR
jgi:transposase